MKQKSLKKPKLLIQSCCGPCSAGAFPFLFDEFLVTAFYFNPNLCSKAEFIGRLGTLKKLLNILKAKVKIETNLHKI